MVIYSIWCEGDTRPWHRKICEITFLLYVISIGDVLSYIAIVKVLDDEDNGRDDRM